jgi:hypothetical protein
MLQPLYFRWLNLGGWLVDIAGLEMMSVLGIKLGLFSPIARNFTDCIIRVHTEKG